MRRNSGNNLLKAAVAAAALLIFFNLPIVRSAAPAKWAGSIVSAAVYPVQFAAYKTVTVTGHIAGSFISLRKAQKENEKLRARLIEEIALKGPFTSIIDENRALRKLLNFKRSNPAYSTAVAAEVIARSSSSWFEVIEIDKGTADGVYPNKAVINENGLIGKVIEAGKRSSMVRLISDPGSSISVTFKRTGDTGSASGLGVDKLKVKYIHSSAAIRMLDEAVTSGASGTYPRGIPVGRVSDIGKKDYDLFQQLIIDTAVDLTKLDKVLVLR